MLTTNDYEYFRELVRKSRLCCIGGPHVGKTALAVRLALDFRDLGYQLWANIDMEGANNLDRIFALDPAKRSCVILEDASLELSDEKHAEAFLEHILSREIIVLMPSTGLPHDLLQVLKCDVYRPLPRWHLPMSWRPKGLVCSWRISGATYPGSSGSFRWRNPEEVHSLYDHRHPGHRTYMDGYSA